MSTDIEAAISRYVAEQMLKQPKRIIAPDEKLISSGLVDSFHLVDLALFVEEAFGVHLDDAELNAESFDTPAQLAALIRSRKASA